MGDNDLGSFRPSICPSVRPSEICPSGWISPTPMHLLQSPHETSEVLSGSNSKWPTYRHFCLLKLTKYLKIWPSDKYLSNTNEHFFPILYTCINYHPPMNPMKFCPDEIQNGQLIAIFVLLKLTKYLKNFVCPDKYRQHQWIFFFPIVYTCINYNPPMNPVKFFPDEIQNGRLITMFVCSNWQNIWKFCPSGWISPIPINIGFRYFKYALTTILQ